MAKDRDTIKTIWLADVVRLGTRMQSFQSYCGIRMPAALPRLTPAMSDFNMNVVHVDVIHPVGKLADRWRGPQ